VLTETREDIRSSSPAIIPFRFEGKDLLRPTLRSALFYVEKGLAAGKLHETTDHHESRIPASLPNDLVVFESGSFFFKSRDRFDNSISHRSDRPCFFFFCHRILCFNLSPFSDRIRDHHRPLRGLRSTIFLKRRVCIRRARSTLSFVAAHSHCIEHITALLTATTTTQRPQPPFLCVLCAQLGTYVTSQGIRKGAVKGAVRES
jgi:hypothetical protein